MTATHPPLTQDRADRPAPESAQVKPQGPPRVVRPLYLAGAIAAGAAALAGLAALTLIAAVGWIAAPHATLGGGLPGVLRTATQLWLIGHHVGFRLHGVGLGGPGRMGTGAIGLLPLGLVLLPGALLWRSGRWVARTSQVARLRHVGYAALALALPYGLLTGSLAVASRTPLSSPSPVQAALAGFLLAFAAGGLGAARALAPWRRLISLLPDRVRCLVVGVTGSLAVLAGAGALLTGISLIDHAIEFRLVSDDLSAGLIGSALLLLAGLAYLPNAVVWAIAYMLGPGFAFGVGTAVTPTGAVLGPLPLFPLLAALPAGSLGPRPAAPGWAGPALLAVPFLAGAFGGLLTVRTAPSLSIEAAPLWGFGSGALSGVVLGALAAFSGGPLGTARLATTGPSGWQVGLVAALELGIAAAITAGLANWLVIRRLTPAVPPTDFTTTPAPEAGVVEVVGELEEVGAFEVVGVVGEEGGAVEEEPDLPPKAMITSRPLDPSSPIEPSSPREPSSPVDPSHPTEPEGSDARVMYLVPPPPDDE